MFGLLPSWELTYPLHPHPQDASQHQDYVPFLGSGILSKKNLRSFGLVYFRSTPHPVTVTTRIITFLVGNPYKPLFVTVTGWGVDPRYIP